MIEQTLTIRWSIMVWKGLIKEWKDKGHCINSCESIQLVSEFR